MDTVAPYGARWKQRDRLLKERRQGGSEEESERGRARGQTTAATAEGGRKRNAWSCRRSATREKERGRNKSGKNESIGGVFHDAPLEALRWESAIGGVRLI